MADSLTYLLDIAPFAKTERLLETVRSTAHPGEVWKPCVDRHGVIVPGYLVSSHGRILSIPISKRGKVYRGNLLRANAQYRGHLGALLCTGVRSRPFRAFVHQLVAWAFLGIQPAELPHIRHLDGNPANNRCDNLEYGTPWMNQMDRFRGYEKGPIAVVIGPSMERHLRDVADRFPKENVLRLLVKSLDRAHQRGAEQRKTEIADVG